MLPNSLSPIWERAGVRVLYRPENLYKYCLSANECFFTPELDTPIDLGIPSSINQHLVGSGVVLSPSPLFFHVTLTPTLSQMAREFSCQPFTVELS